MLQLFQRRYLVLVKTAIRSLLLHKLRSLLTVLGLVFGVGSVVVMLAVAEGADRESALQLRALGVRNIYLKSVKPKKAAAPGAGMYFSFTSAYGFVQQDLKDLTDAFPTIAHVVPIRRTKSKIRIREKIEALDRVAVQENYLSCNRLELAAGRFVHSSDVKSRRCVCVLGEGLARKYFQFQDPIGKLVELRDESGVDGFEAFRVVGVVRELASADGSARLTTDYRKEVFVPLSSDLARFGSVITIMGDSYSQEDVEMTDLLVQVEREDQVAATADFLEGWLERTHPREDYEMSVPLELLEQARKRQRIFAAVVGSIAAISLLVGGIGIMNIMLATVSERTREIGVRRALGARRSDIVWQFLVETLVLSVVGATMGLLMGLAVPSLITQVSGLQTHITIWGLISSVAVALFVGVVSGVYPARRAALLDPVQALQHN